MTSINTSFNPTIVPQQSTTEKPGPIPETSKGWDDPIGQFIAAWVEKKERLSAPPPEVQKRLDGWQAFLDQFLLDKNGGAKNENGDYLDEENKFRDKDGNLIDIGEWINNWLIQKRMSSVSI